MKERHHVPAPAAPRSLAFGHRGPPLPAGVLLRVRGTSRREGSFAETPMGFRDRRRTPRHVPAREVARVGWWRGTEFQHVAATLRDLSGTGAALSVDGTLEQADAVWVCLAGANSTDWVRSSVAWSGSGSNGDSRIGLIFGSVCPLQAFRAAIWGSPADPSAPSFPTEVSLVPPPRDEPSDSDPKRGANASPFIASDARLSDEWTYIAVAGAEAGAPSLPASVALNWRDAPQHIAPAAWIVPAIVKASLAAILAVVAIKALSNAQILEPLVTCLTQE